MIIALSAVGASVAGDVLESCEFFDKAMSFVEKHRASVVPESASETAMKRIEEQISLIARGKDIYLKQDGRRFYEVKNQVDSKFVPIKDGPIHSIVMGNIGEREADHITNEWVLIGVLLTDLVNILI